MSEFLLTFGAGFMDELRYSAGGEWSDVPG